MCSNSQSCEKARKIIPIQIIFAAHQLFVVGVKQHIIGVNLSSNAYLTNLLPNPLIPSPLTERGSFGFRQNWGGMYFTCLGKFMILAFIPRKSPTYLFESPHFRDSEPRFI